MHGVVAVQTDEELLSLRSVDVPSCFLEPALDMLESTPHAHSKQPARPAARTTMPMGSMCDSEFVLGKKVVEHG